MRGSWRPDRGGGPGRVLSRCEARRSRALPPELAHHPPTLYVREDAILRHLDPWIESLADPAWLSETDEDHAADRADIAGLRAQRGRLEAKITNLMVAIEAGGDGTVLMERLTARNAEREVLRNQIALMMGRAGLSPVDIAALIDELGGIAAVLRKASANEKLAIYDTLGLQLVYDDVIRQVRATANLARVASRVGGGT
jgi:site-specific DNA recombinase